MKLWSWGLVLLILVAGCAHHPRLVLPAPPRVDEIGALLDGVQLAPGDDVRVTALQKGESSSVSLVQIRDREVPHIHSRYDIMVLLVRGEGALHLDGRVLPMRTGDAAFVPKGAPHFFVNHGSDPAAALVTFAPAFDGPDQQPIQP